MLGNFSFRTTALAMVAGVTMALAASNAHAQALEKIKEAGVIRVGVMGEQAPWGSMSTWQISSGKKWA
jgi:polar amino acid transport system substrate-binding protein